MSPQRQHSIEEIRDHWLKNRGADRSDWEQALGAVYDLGMSAVVSVLNGGVGTGASEIIEIDEAGNVTGPADLIAGLRVVRS